MLIKDFLKLTRAYKYYNCVKRYRKASTESIASALVHVKPVIYGGKKQKITQLEEAFNRVRIHNCGKGSFFYSLDEEVVLYNKHKVIENMPINYQLIIDHSINELESLFCDQSEIGKQNSGIILILKKYIERASEADKSADVLKNIVYRKAETVEEALQRVLFINQFLWQTGHKLIGLGRLDKVLDRFPEAEDEDQIIKNFLLSLHEHYIYKSSVMPGDTGQIIILGGKNPDGTYFSNRFTYKVLACLGALNIPDPKILVRASADMPEDLLRACAQLIASGSGSPLLSNDDVLIERLIAFGYAKEDAYNYGVSACWEPLSIGNSLEQNNIASIEFGLAAHKTLTDDRFLNCHSIEEVLSLFYCFLDECINSALDTINRIAWERDPLVTLFTDGCLEKNLDISEGGAVYNDYGLLSEGMSSAVNSLLNIEKYCFSENRYSLSEIRKAIQTDYVGCESIRNLFDQNAEGFGTDSKDAIDMTNLILEHTNAIVSAYRNGYGGKVKYGLSSPNYITLGQRTKATADGRADYAPFSTHISRDKAESPTSIILFASALHYTWENCNANVVDYMITSNILTDHLDKFVILLRTAIRKGVFQIQFNVTSYKQLMAAREHPELYPNLIVRVWGFSAYFNDLPDDYKDLLIKRAREAEGIA